jgi:hypothetical protein
MEGQHRPCGLHVVCPGTSAELWQPGKLVRPSCESGAASAPFVFAPRHVMMIRPAAAGAARRPDGGGGDSQATAAELAPDEVARGLTPVATTSTPDLKQAIVRLGMEPLLSTVLSDGPPPAEQQQQQQQPCVLHVVPCGAKGCGVTPLKPLTRGEPVCDYSGEILSTAEACSRQREYDQAGGMNYLLVVLEHLPDRVVRTSIDPTQYGGVARCINHSCRPNLQPTVVRDHCIVPTVRFVAARDIEAGEELTFDYGALGSRNEEGDDLPGGNPHRGRTVCLCGETDYCCGFLPFNPS